MAKYKTFFEKFIIGLTFIFLVYYTLFSAVLAVYSAIDLYDEYKFNNWSSSFIDSPAPPRSNIIYKKGFWNLNLGGNSDTTYFSVQWIISSELNQESIRQYYEKLALNENNSEKIEIYVDNYEKEFFNIVSITRWVKEQKELIKAEDYFPQTLYIVAIMQPNRIDNSM